MPKQRVPYSKNLTVAERRLADLQSRFSSAEVGSLGRSSRKWATEPSLESARLQANNAQQRTRDLRQDWQDLMAATGAASPR